jgi:hypothetical protein
METFVPQLPESKSARKPKRPRKATASEEALARKRNAS